MQWLWDTACVHGSPVSLFSSDPVLHACHGQCPGAEDTDSISVIQLNIFLAVQTIRVGKFGCSVVCGSHVMVKWCQQQRACLSLGLGEDVQA